MADEAKTELDVYKELYEKEKKEKERLKVQAIKAQAYKPVDELVTAKPSQTRVNPSADITAVRAEFEAFKQEVTRTVTALVGQFNNLVTEQSNVKTEIEKIRTQARKNYENITYIGNLLNGGK